MSSVYENIFPLDTMGSSANFVDQPVSFVGQKCMPAHEIMALFVLRKLILQTRMRSLPVGG